MHPPLLDEVIEAHGGLERYESASTLRTQLHVDGLALLLKWQRGALADYTGVVSTKEPHVILEPFSKPEHRGVLQGEAVQIENASGDVIARRSNPRAGFRSPRRQLWWDDLDLCYFAAYALWGYLNAPFVLARPEFETREIDPWVEDEQSWRGLEVRFPDDIPAHSKVQRYYFDGRGLLRRNDYTAEVFGGWAKAAHYCFDYKEMDGIMVPTRRRAMPRAGNGKPRRSIGLVNIAIDSVELQ